MVSFLTPNCMGMSACMKHLPRPPFTLEEASRFVLYCPHTGVFTSALTGKSVGFMTVNGYVAIVVNRRRLTAHRLAWYMYHREWPTIVDHINGDKVDNRIANLRLINKAHNAINSRKANSASGYRCVYKHGKTRWTAKFRGPEGIVRLGTFSSPELAHRAVVATMLRIYPDHAPYRQPPLPPLDPRYRPQKKRIIRDREIIETERAKIHQDRLVRAALMREGSDVTHRTFVAAISYDPETGHFTWNIGRRSTKPAGYTAPDGRKYVHINCNKIFAHRAAWYHMTGAWPPRGLHVDHINGDHGDNRWCNLRLATPEQNSANTSIRRDSTTRFKGVRRHWTGRYEATIYLNGKPTYLGGFATPEEAHAVYCEAARLFRGNYARENPNVKAPQRG